jgi:hypothetical protein
VKINPKDLFECRCGECPISGLCGLLTGNYCPYYNCIVPKITPKT